MIDDATATLCELASLYALGSLDADESRQFEEHLIDGCTVCRADLDRLRFTVDLLALAPEPVTPPASLRARILESLLQPTSDEIVPVASSSALQFEDEGPWKPYSVPGIEYRMLHLERSSREVVMLVRAESGSRYPMHQHTSTEEMFMLRGELVLDGTTYGPGDFIRSTKGSQHGVGDTPGGCMFLMRGSIDDLVFESGQTNADTVAPIATE